MAVEADYLAVPLVGVSSLVLAVAAAAGTPAPTDITPAPPSRDSGAGPAEGGQGADPGRWNDGWAEPRFETTASKPPRPGTHGRRLLIASAILGGVALTLNTTRAAWFAVGCKKEGYHYDDGCFGTQVHQSLGTVFLGVPALALNLTGAGLAAGGGYKRGSEGPRISSEAATKHVAWGSAMVGVGIALQITSALLVLSVFRVDSDEIYDGEKDADAFRQRYVGASCGAQAGATLTAAGGGLLFHGLGQRKRGKPLDVAFSATGFSMRF